MITKEKMPEKVTLFKHFLFSRSGYMFIPPQTWIVWPVT
jgi:hypothetical protein